MDDVHEAESSIGVPVAYDPEEIVVTASRRAGGAFLMTYSVNVQGMTELQEFRQVLTVPDAMRDLSGVMVRKTGHAQGAPYTCGYSASRMLFLIDRIRFLAEQVSDSRDRLSTFLLPLSFGTIFRFRSALFGETH